MKRHHRLPDPPTPTLFHLAVTVEPRHEHVPYSIHTRRYPLMYGSAEIELCSCLCWRLKRGCNDEWKNSDVNVAINRASDELEEL